MMPSTLLPLFSRPQSAAPASSPPPNKPSLLLLPLCLLEQNPESPASLPRVPPTSSPFLTSPQSSAFLCSSRCHRVCLRPEALVGALSVPHLSRALDQHIQMLTGLLIRGGKRSEEQRGELCIHLWDDGCPRSKSH